MRWNSARVLHACWRASRHKKRKPTREVWLISAIFCRRQWLAWGCSKLSDEIREGHSATIAEPHRLNPFSTRGSYPPACRAKSAKRQRQVRETQGGYDPLTWGWGARNSSSISLFFQRRNIYPRQRNLPHTISHRHPKDRPCLAEAAFTAKVEGRSFGVHHPGSRRFHLLLKRQR